MQTNITAPTNAKTNDGTYHAAPRPDSQKSKNPAAHDAAEDEVNKNTVAATFHHLSSKPTCD